jgi:hypothetical protein
VRRQPLGKTELHKSHNDPDDMKILRLVLHNDPDDVKMLRWVLHTDPDDVKTLRWVD